MLSTLYTLTINQISGTGDSDGFIDNQTVEQYIANNGDIFPTSLTTSTNKVRANIRYKNVIQNIQLMGNVYVSNVVTTGGDVNTPPTVITLVLESERGDETLITYDELNGNAIIFGANAITRCVERALVESFVNYTYAVFDPTLTQAPQNGGMANAFARHGTYVATFNANALTSSLTAGASSVSVTKIST